jgi:hypothetical protein
LKRQPAAGGHMAASLSTHTIVQRVRSRAVDATSAIVSDRRRGPKPRRQSALGPAPPSSSLLVR